MEDEESFVPCYPPPVNTARLVQLKPLGDRATKVTHMAAWYGVLAAYAQYTAELLEDKEELPRQVAKKLTTVYQMLQSVLQLFTDVVSIAFTQTNTLLEQHLGLLTHTQTTRTYITSSCLPHTDRTSELHKRFRDPPLRIQRPHAVHGELRHSKIRRKHGHTPTEHSIGRSRCAKELVHCGIDTQIPPAFTGKGSTAHLDFSLYQQLLRRSTLPSDPT